MPDADDTGDTDDVDDTDDTADAQDGSAELAELRMMGERLRPGDVTWEPAPPELWARVAAATGVPAVRAVDVVDSADTPRTAHPARTARARRWWVGVAAAAAAVVLVVAGAVVVLRDDDTDDADDVTVLGATTLEPLGDTGSGRAELVDDGGALRLRVETADVDAGSGYLELWLIDPTVTRLVSLGPLRPDGTYDLPPGVDPAAFPIVDVSAEPVDGDPTHSGDSLLRGQLVL